MPLDSPGDAVLAAAAVATGLQAGTYYTWATGVMPGLARVDDRAFVRVMQQVNVAIVNPAFLASFLGAPVLGVLAALLVGGSARPWAVAGAVLAVASLGVTVAGNIPLNNALDRAGPVEDEHELVSARTAFETRWVRLNLVRALASTGSLVALVVAALEASG